MRWIILRMIATGSLSAFSASALQGVQAPAGVLPVRAQALSAPTAQLNAPRPAALPSDRPAPRGSLLDLSV